MFLGSRPASGTRIGTATWPYNALLVELSRRGREVLLWAVSTDSQRERACVGKKPWLAERSARWLTAWPSSLDDKSPLHSLTRVWLRIPSACSAGSRRCPCGLFSAHPCFPTRPQRLGHQFARPARFRDRALPRGLPHAGCARVGGGRSTPCVS